jgi:hypothetical protein
MARKKSKKKTAKKAVKKKTAKRRKSSGVAKVASLAKKPLSQLLTLQARVAKAMETRVKKGRVKTRKEQEKGILAGLFSGPRRPSKEDKAMNAATESLSRFSASQMARLASRAGD